MNALWTSLKGDKVIWIIMFLLAMVSILTVYSATGTLAFAQHKSNTEYYLFKHSILIALGFVIAYACHNLPYLFYGKLAPWLILATIPLLVVTLAAGTELNEARRWLPIPFTTLSFQTSDLAKIALIIYVAKTITSKMDTIKDFKNAFLPIIIPVCIICGLIAPANLSTAIILFVVCVLMMVVGRVHLKYIFLMLLSGLVIFGFLIMLADYVPNVVRLDTWISRTNDFIHGTGDQYQISQAKMAIAHGELFGVGPGNSIQRNFMPSSFADFIYATITEEYGLVGATFVLGLYLVFFFRCVKLVTQSPKAFGTMLAVGLSLLIVIQAISNMMVSVHLLPVTGQPLPLVSMGGTSIIFSCIAFGIILSVSRYTEKINKTAT